MWPAWAISERIWSLASPSSLQLRGMRGSSTTHFLQHLKSMYLWTSPITYRIQPVPGTHNSTLEAKLRFSPTLASILDLRQLLEAGVLERLSQCMFVASLIAHQVKGKLSKARILSLPVGIFERSGTARYHDLHTRDLVPVLVQWATALARYSPGATQPKSSPGSASLSCR